MNKWWRKDTQEEDEMVVVGLDLVLETAMDADATNQIVAQHGVNERDSRTVAEVQEMRRELELRRFGWRRN